MYCNGLWSKIGICPAYAKVQKMMHARLAELREHYGDSDANDQKYLKAYLDHREAARQRRSRR